MLLADAGKGAADLPRPAAGRADERIEGCGGSRLAALGHNFSPFLGFRGGKGGPVVLGISAVMLLGITAITVAFGAIEYGVTRHAVWSMTGTFVLLNALTIATLQPLTQILLCLMLSSLVAGTHLWRQYPQVSLAVWERRWRKYMMIE
ncbi:MAG: glycerol-3-phosphate acyltransferase [SAR202 cluster bacterium]|nr:glycerol-3-phosphate acyltransferase [SAR202 cluster bacterium]MDP6301120.1 glycerol-3-phosphate acyltransferase [SAR202 cluster bacterium]MDP7104818.1 glycerol-3-phosphate acyltransferase [SAR202 cluster bacterium]MDP7225269.1 glycerol-3-phosphate acyltransferase [SAR202 cluster bacterium]MDP7532643.1 glycerol-3-phosphate acyltransferase [SAR202 cluster bacterium]